MCVFCWQDADVLYRKHQEVSAQLELKYNETRLARERAAELKERATDMYTSTKTKVDRLTGKGFVGAVVLLTILREVIVSAVIRIASAISFRFSALLFAAALMLCRLQLCFLTGDCKPGFTACQEPGDFPTRNLA